MPSVWRGLRRCAPANRGVRFCLCVIVPLFVILSVFNGKQFHYLIPAFPPLALIAARGLAASRDHWRWGDVLLPALPPALVGLVLLAWPVASGLPFLAERADRAPAWLAALSPLWGLAFLAAALLPCAIAAWRRAGATLAVCATTLLSLIAVHVVGSVAIFAAYDLTAVSAYLQKHADLPIAYNRDYEGEFGFLGRLHGRRVEFVHEPDMAGWIARHGRALVVARYRTRPAFLTGAPALEQPYRGQRIGVWLTTGGARRPP
jgi:hypothetical protein